MLPEIDWLSACAIEANIAVDHFTGHFRSVNAFFLEVHTDAEQFQFPNRFQAFLGIACEAGDRLYQDTVDLSLSAVG